MPSTKQTLAIAQLQEMGFSAEAEKEARRLIVSISGPEKSAKTHFGLTAPEPVFLFNIDRGTEGVLGKFQASGKKIYVYTIRLAKGLPQEAYAAMWRDVKERFNMVFKVGEGTIMMDTASEMHELSRLSHFGKLSQVKPHHYSEVNAEWRKEVLDGIYDSGMNAVLIHKIKPRYVDEKRTKDFDIAGFNDTGYAVQCNVISSRERDEDGNIRFNLHITDCRKNASLCGQDLIGQPVESGSDLHIDPIVNFEFLLNAVHEG